MNLPDLDTKVRDTWFCHDAEEQVMLVKELVVSTALNELYGIRNALAAAAIESPPYLNDRIKEYKAVFKKVKS